MLDLAYLLVAFKYGDSAVHCIVRKPVLAERTSPDPDHFLFTVQDFKTLARNGLSDCQMVELEPMSIAASFIRLMSDLDLLPSIYLTTTGHKPRPGWHQAVSKDTSERAFVTSIAEEFVSV